MNEPEAEAQAPRQRPQPGIRQTLRLALRLIREQPRQTLLPMAVVQFPLAILSAVASAALYFSVFDDEPYPEGGLSANLVDLEGGQLFAVLIILGVTFLFSTVGQAATIVAVAGAARGEHVSLSSALDPAFTRIGTLLLVTLGLAGGMLAVVLTIVGIVILPYLFLRLALWTNVLMLENVSGLEAVRRSWRMTPGHILRLLIVIVVTVVAVLVVATIVSIPVVGTDADREVRIISDSILEVIGGTLLVPALVFFQAVMTVFYLGVRASADGNQRAA